MGTLEIFWTQFGILVLRRVSKFVIPEFRDTLLVPKITKCGDLLYTNFRLYTVVDQNSVVCKSSVKIVNKDYVVAQFSNVGYCTWSRTLYLISTLDQPESILEYLWSYCSNMYTVYGREAWENLQHAMGLFKLWWLIFASHYFLFIFRFSFDFFSFHFAQEKR